MYIQGWQQDEEYHQPKFYYKMFWKIIAQNYGWLNNLTEYSNLPKI